LPTASADDLAGKGHPLCLQPFNRLLDVFHAHRHVVEYLVAKLIDPTRDDTRAAPIVGIRLIHEERRVPNLPIDLRIPVLIFNRFTVPISKPHEFLRPLIDVQRSQREMVCDRIETDSRLVQRVSQHLGCLIVRHIVVDHPGNQCIEFSALIHDGHLHGYG
jgi:hypothetical protein